MEKIKSFFSRFKDDRGIFGVDDLVVLAVVGVVVVAVGLHSLGEYSEVQGKKIDKVQTTIENLPDTGDTSDANEAHYEGKKILVDSYKKCLEDGISLGLDETGGLGLVKETGVFDLPKDKEEKQEDSGSSKSDAVFVEDLKGGIKDYAGDTDRFAIEEKLDENNLPTDAITQDITKIVINSANQLGSSDSEIEDIVDASIETMKDLTNKDEDEDINDDSSETLEKIKEKLSEENKLEDEVIINKRKEYNAAVLEKKELEKENEVHEYYKDTDTIIISDEIYIKTQKRLDHLNKRIDALEKELQENEENSEDQDIEDVSVDEEVSEEIVEDTKGAPTINLKIVAGPTYSEADGVCYYRVKAVVTGDPYPGITFSKDSSGGAWGSKTVQINLRDGGSYTLRATATNSEGSATDSIHLSWGCAVEDTEDTPTGGGSTSTDDGGSCPYGG